MAAKIYKEKLLDKSFMFVYNNEFIEIIFKRNNFKHLTGVNSTLSANQFFRNALMFRIFPSQIKFDSYHPYKLAIEKLTYINKINELMYKQCVVLKDISTQTCKYTFGSTNLYFVLLFEKEINEQGNLLSSKLIVKSLRGDSCIDKANTKYFVDYIFSKDSNSNKYNKICYYRNLQIELPRDLIIKLDKSIIDKLICNITKL